MTCSAYSALRICYLQEPCQALGYDGLKEPPYLLPHRADCGFTVQQAGKGVSKQHSYVWSTALGPRDGNWKIKTLNP